jgi:hypothetical protein
MHDHIKHGLDATAAGAAFASFVGWLPGVLSVVASALSICWLGIQIYEWWDRKKKEREEHASR